MWLINPLRLHHPHPHYSLRAFSRSIIPSIDPSNSIHSISSTPSTSPDHLQPKLSSNQQPSSIDLDPNPKLNPGTISNRIGRLYELHSMRCMHQVLSIRDLVHVGKRGSQDGGIDIKGWWYSNQDQHHHHHHHPNHRDRDVDQENIVENPSEPQPTSKLVDPHRPLIASTPQTSSASSRSIKFIAQCKSSKVILSLVREIEGLVASCSSTHSYSKPTIGLLFASKGFTTASLERAQRSPFPIILLSLDLPPISFPTSSSLALELDPDLDPDHDHSLDRLPTCITRCYPNPVAVRLLRPYEFIRTSKLTNDGLPAQHSWILVNRSLDSDLQQTH